MSIESRVERPSIAARARALRQSERGTALLEAAVTIPLLLLIAVGTFEFGRAYQTWQVLTNAAREGARISVLPASTNAAVESRVRSYLEGGALPRAAEAEIAVDRSAMLDVNGAPVSASEITVNYPFEFMVLQPVAQLVSGNGAAGGPLTMRAAVLMRNETQ